MPLSKEKQNKSLTNLQARLGNNLSSEAIDCLKALNEKAAYENIVLSAQSKEVSKLILTHIKESSFSDRSPEKVANELYRLIIEQLNKETYENKNKHRKQGYFDNRPIYQRRKDEQLNDEDITALMPKSHGNIEVLAPINIEDESPKAIKKGIITALKDDQKSHIITLTGPGHWRGVSLSKPTENNKNYQLELFDSFGSESVKKIKDFIQRLLVDCGINIEQITVKTKEPRIRQQDPYSCGDFALAYCHNKMREFGAPETAYEPELISTMENKGNRNNALREISRKISKRNQENEILAHQDKFEEKTANPIKKFTEQEKKVYAATLRLQEKPSPNYKKEVASLIKNRHSIFNKANDAIAKEQRKERLSDEELANKLQAEEFIKVGFKLR